jgi:hypothetical protein
VDTQKQEEKVQISSLLGLDHKPKLREVARQYSSGNDVKIIDVEIMTSP